MARHGKNDFHNGRDYGADRPAGGGLLGDGVGALVGPLVVPVGVVVGLVRVLAHGRLVPVRRRSKQVPIGTVAAVTAHRSERPA